jgi:hypothetical protein
MPAGTPALLGFAAVRDWLRARQAAGLLQCAAQEIFDLRIQAPEFIARPTLERGVGLRVESHQEWLAIRHDHRLGVKRSSVHDRLRVPVAAKDHE